MFLAAEVCLSIIFLSEPYVHPTFKNLCLSFNVSNASLHHIPSSLLGLGSHDPLVFTLCSVMISCDGLHLLKRGTSLMRSDSKKWRHKKDQNNGNINEYINMEGGHFTGSHPRQRTIDN